MILLHSLLRGVAQSGLEYSSGGIELSSSFKHYKTEYSRELGFS